MDEKQSDSRGATAAFAVQTTFASALDRIATVARLTLLRALRPEAEARSLGSLHFASWICVPREKWRDLTRLRRPTSSPRDQMLFQSDFSGDWEFYLEGFQRVIQVALDAAWKGAEGWREQMQLGEFLAFVRGHHLPADAYHAVYGTASVSDVRSALRVCDALESLLYHAASANESEIESRFTQLCMTLGPDLAPLPSVLQTRAVSDRGSRSVAAPQLDRADIQGNILESYSFHDLAVVKHLFVAFPSAENGRRALQSLEPWVSRAEIKTKLERGEAVNLGLSYAGLLALGVADDELANLPPAFRAGMRARAQLLGDDPDSFDAPWSEDQPVHLWLWLHATDNGRLERLEKDVRGCLVDCSVLGELNATVPSGPAESRVEHFGFRDGVSGVSIQGSLAPPLPGAGKPTADGGWEPLAAGEFILGQLDEAGEIALAGSALARNGTFAVLRKLEQDVRGFRHYVREQARRHALSEDWVAERIVGRKRDGTSLFGRTPGEDANDFHFIDDAEGRVCPRGSHIRRTNGRDGHAFLDAASRHRIIRRGAPYGTPLPESMHGPSAVREVCEHGRGLIFIALNADLERQFEFLQRIYINDGAASVQGSATDPLVGHARNGARELVIPGDTRTGRSTVVCSHMPNFVECLGGEYFLLPGLAALRAIAGIQVDSTCSSSEEEAAQ